MVHVGAPYIGADWQLGEREVEILAALGAAETTGAAARALAERSVATPDQVLALARSALVHGALTVDAG
jgi:hypothetical protein